jgi:hypothetical protein
MRRSLLTLLLSLTPACAMGRVTVNEPLDPSRLSLLYPGVTTAHEAVELLGAPDDIVQLGKRSAYRYRYTSTKVAGLSPIPLLLIFYNVDSRSDRAWLFFDENQVLTHLGVTLEAEKNEYAMPWEDVYD